MDQRRRLDGWKTLAAFLRVSVRQARRLASHRVPDDLRLPVFALTRAGGARVCAYVDELLAWEARVAARNRVATRD